MGVPMPCYSSISEKIDEPPHAPATAAGQSERDPDDASLSTGVVTDGGTTGDAVPPGTGVGEDEEPAWNGLWQLPDEEVQWVLSWKRSRLTSGVVPPHGVAAFEALGDMFEEYQQWMRREYEANGGVVLVDDECIARREERIKWLQEELRPVEWDESDLAYWNVSDRLSDFYESDDDDEAVVQELETN